MTRINTSSEDIPNIVMENDDGIQSNTSIENTNTPINEQENVKPESNGQVVLTIDEPFQDKPKRDKFNKDFMVYEQHGQNTVLPTTLVYYQGPITSDGPSLDYTPDRNSFIRLVFTIVFIMIMCTALLNCLVYLSETLMEVFETMGFILAIIAMGVMIGLNYAMACSSCARVMPCNIICLILAVICMSILCCFVTIRYETKIVIFAVAATAGVVLLCVALACTSFDFTSWLLYVMVIAGAFGIVSLIIFMYMMISGTYMKLVHLIILYISTGISVVVLIIELQMILGGKAIELSEDDYALGAYMLYTSIIDIFLKLVQIIGITDGDW